MKFCQKKRSTNIFQIQSSTYGTDDNKKIKEEIIKPVLFLKTTVVTKEVSAFV